MTKLLLQLLFHIVKIFINMYVCSTFMNQNTINYKLVVYS